MKLGSGLRVAVALVLGLVLSACSNQPPGCGDKDVAATAKQMLTGKMLEHARQADDPDRLLAGYIDRLRVDLVNIVDDGYDSQTRKQSCSGTLKVKAEDGWGFERPVSYAAQRLVDAPESFQLEMEDGLGLTMAVATQVRAYYEARRWTGEWSGSYACQAVEGAADGPGAAFSMPVTLVVEGEVARLERTTRGGGIEKLEGKFSHAALKHGTLQLSGQGMNSPDDKWSTEFEGEAHGREAIASGKLRASDGTVLRRCELKLTQAVAKS